MEKKQTFKAVQVTAIKQTVADFFVNGFNSVRNYDYFTLLGKVDSNPVSMRIMALFMGFMIYTVGMNSTQYWPTNIVQFDYHNTIFNMFPYLAIGIVVLSLFESLRRNDLWDTFWVITAIAINYFVLTSSANWTLIAIAYGIGFGLAHYASHSGKLDWTPMVAFNGAFIGISAYTFEGGASSVIWPILVAVVYQVIELLRNHDYHAVRLSYLGLAIALVGLVFSMNPLPWIVTGSLISFFVVPTALKVYHLHKGKFGSWLEGSSEPCKDWNNELRNIRLNFESGMFTLVTSAFFSIVTVLFFS